MDIILGATGHVGSAVTKNLLSHGEHVTAVTHDAKKLDDLKSTGVEVEVVDIHDTDRLKEVLSKGDRIFLLNPPADIALDDAVKEEKVTVYSMINALEGLNAKKIVAESTYGAQPGDGLGDLGVLHELERGVAKSGLPHAIIRAAYYMTNWEMSLKTAQEEGVVYSLYPADFKLPMVDPEDIGAIAADLLIDDNTSGIFYVEGPQEYSPRDVALAFEKALGFDVRAVTVPEPQWAEWLMGQGFSRAAADSMVKMTELTLNKKEEAPARLRRGKTTLDQFIARLVEKNVIKH